MMLKSYPSIDVHGETRDTVIYLINQFLKDNVIMNKRNVVIIHGKGEGILRKAVHEILKKSPLVEEFHLDGMNLGATEVILKIKSKFDESL